MFESSNARDILRKHILRINSGKAENPAMTAFAVSSSFSRAVPTRLSRLPGRSAGSPSAGVAHRAFSACTLCALPKVWWRCPCGGWSGERSVHVSASAAVPPQGVSVRTPARGYRAGSSHRQRMEREGVPQCVFEWRPSRPNEW